MAQERPQFINHFFSRYHGRTNKITCAKHRMREFKTSYPVFLRTIFREKDKFLPDFNEKMLIVRRIITEHKSQYSLRSLLFNLFGNMMCVLLIVASFAFFYDMATSKRFIQNFAPQDRYQWACDMLINIINSDVSKLPALPQWCNASTILKICNGGRCENGKKSFLYFSNEYIEVDCSERKAKIANSKFE